MYLILNQMYIKVLSSQNHNFLSDLARLLWFSFCLFAWIFCIPSSSSLVFFHILISDRRALSSKNLYFTILMKKDSCLSAFTLFPQGTLIVYHMTTSRESRVNSHSQASILNGFWFTPPAVDSLLVLSDAPSYFLVLFV